VQKNSSNENTNKKKQQEQQKETKRKKSLNNGLGTDVKVSDCWTMSWGINGNEVDSGREGTFPNAFTTYKNEQRNRETIETQKKADDLGL